jgi:hypothetical protein
LGALGDDRDIGEEGVEVVALAGESHFAVPDYDAHGASSYRLREKERKGIYAEGAETKRSQRREEKTKRDFSLRRPTRSQERT